MNESQLKDAILIPCQRRIQSFLGTPFSAGGLGVAVMLPVGPGQSPGGGPGGKAPGSSWDLVIYLIQCNFG